MTARPGAGALELRNAPRFWVRRLFVTAVIGGGAAVLYFANLSSLLGLRSELERLVDRGGDGHPNQFIGTFLFSALICGGISIASWWVRQPAGARITWDETAITELDGPAIRTCIPWSTALQRKVEVVEVRKGEETPGGGMVQLSDAEGRRITVNASTTSFRWMNTRRMSTPVALLELWNRASLQPVGTPFAPDPASLKRPTFALWPMLTFAAAIAVTIGLFLLRRGGGAWVVKAADEKVLALETDQARVARETLVRAVLLEIGLRLLIVGALVALLVLWDFERRRS